MSEIEGNLTSDKLSQVVVKGMQEKKAKDITVLDLRKVNNAVSDFFVICSGTSDTQIQSIAESIEKEVFLSNKEDPWHKEGLNNKSWVLIDYVNVVAHIFKKDEREYYNLESLWGDAEVETFEDL